MVKFRLYAAGDTRNFAQARANLSTLWRACLVDTHDVEVVEPFGDPRALADGTPMTPTRVRPAPYPIRSIISTPGQTQFVLQTLGLETIAA